MGFGETLAARGGLFLGIIGLWFLSGMASVKGNSASIQQSPVLGAVLLLAGVGLFAASKFVLGSSPSS